MYIQDYIVFVVYRKGGLEDRSISIMSTWPEQFCNQSIVQPRNLLASLA